MVKKLSRTRKRKKKIRKIVIRFAWNKGHSISFSSFPFRSSMPQRLPRSMVSLTGDLAWERYRANSIIHSTMGSSLSLVLTTPSETYFRSDRFSPCRVCNRVVAYMRREKREGRGSNERETERKRKERERVEENEGRKRKGGSITRDRFERNSKEAN